MNGWIARRACCAAAACLLGGLLVTAATPSAAAAGDAAADSEDPGAEWGIRVLGVRRTAADYMLEFRFRVVEPDKAAPLMDRKTKPKLVVERSGRTLHVPVSSKVGPLRQSPKFAHADRDYFMFFANPGRAVTAGDVVRVEIGSFSAPGLVVE